MEHAGEAASFFGGGDFGDEEGGGDGGNADADAPDKAGEDKRMDVCCEGGPEGGGEVEDSDGEERFFSAEAVGGPGADQGAENRSHEGGRDCPSVHEGAEVPQFLDGLFGAGDDDGIEAEEESGEGGGDGPEEEAGLHRASRRAGDLSGWPEGGGETIYICEIWLNICLDNIIKCNDR